MVTYPPFFSQGRYDVTGSCLCDCRPPTKAATKIIARIYWFLSFRLIASLKQRAAKRTDNSIFSISHTYDVTAHVGNRETFFFRLKRDLPPGLD